MEIDAFILLILSCFISLIINIIISQGGECPMTARERILTMKLLEKLERNPAYAHRIGIQVDMRKKDPKETED